MFDRVPLNLCLNKSVFMALLGKTSELDYSSISMRVFKQIDINVANSLQFILDNDIDALGDSLEFFFTVTQD